MKNNIQQKQESPLQYFRDKLKISNSKFFEKLQYLGKAMLFPIIVLPLAAIFLRFGTLMTDTTLAGIKEGNAIWYIGKILMAIGQPAFDNLAIIFGIGLAFGLAKDHRGEAAIAGAIASWVLASLLGEHTFASLFYNKVMVYHHTGNDDPLKVLDGYSQLLYMVKANARVWALNIGVLGGLVAGGMTAWCYNKWHTIKMPPYLSLIEGRRFIPVVSILFMIPMSLIFAVIWPWVQYGLIQFGITLMNWGKNGGAAYGVSFIYVLLKNLLVLFGLHNVLSAFVWFQLPFSNGSDIINGDIPAFTAGIQGSGLFQVGSFGGIMGGYWGLTLAIIFCAKKENRKKVAAFMLPVCTACAITGVGEPLILPIWYASPMIYLLDSFFSALFGSIPAAMGVRAGFAFSAGWLDYILSIPTSWKMASNSAVPWLANPLWLIVNAFITAGAYFGIFYFVIKNKNIQTLGRGNIMPDSEVVVTNQNNVIDKKPKVKSLLAQEILNIIKKDNLISVSNCATRLRLQVKDTDAIDEKAIKKLSVYGVKKIGKTNIQIIIGSGVESIANDLDELIKED